MKLTHANASSLRKNTVRIFLTIVDKQGNVFSKMCVAPNFEFSTSIDFAYIQEWEVATLRDLGWIPKGDR